MEPPSEGCGMKDVSRLVKVNQNTVWDHAAIDAENRLSLPIVPKKTQRDAVPEGVDEIKRRTGGRTGLLMTSGGNAPY
ncbi:MAG: hypothetical protein NTX45_07705 [Proteobacteria bacterium]|nr:hypothetical protein [Pseudomonadota bacterium]